MRIKEESLDKALEAASLQSRGLPKRYAEGKDPFWIRALVLVQKRNMEECYCIYQQGADKYMRLMQDFGTPSTILTIKSIHPYIYLDEARFMPTGNLEERKNYLKRALGDNPRNVEVEFMTECEVNKNLIELGIEQQLKCTEEDRLANQRNEGSDLDGTNIEDLEKQKYETELAFMIKEGVSKEEIKAYKEAFAHRHDPKDEEYLSEEERTRIMMESQDLLEQEKSESEVSVDGEFDPEEIDYKKLNEETEKYRQDILKQQKRKWKRNLAENTEKKEGRMFENEFGENENVQTLQLPPSEEKKKKPGRPKKDTTTKRKATRKTTRITAKDEKK